MSLCLLCSMNNNNQNFSMWTGQFWELRAAPAAGSRSGMSRVMSAMPRKPLNTERWRRKTNMFEIPAAVSVCLDETKPSAQRKEWKEVMWLWAAEILLPEQKNSPISPSQRRNENRTGLSFEMDVCGKVNPWDKNHNHKINRQNYKIEIEILN